MINDMNLLQKGEVPEGCRCKGKTPQTFTSSSSKKFEILRKNCIT